MPDPLPPGVGFPGIIFQETASGAFNKNGDFGNDDNVGSPLDLDGSTSGPEAPQERKKRRKRTKNNKISWRKVQTIVQNPDNQITERMDAIVSAGVGYVAGVPFAIGGTSGIVMYWAREDVDLKRLRTAENEGYLRAAAHLVGSAWAVRGPRQILLEQMERKKKENFGKVRRKMHQLLKMSSLDELAQPKLGTPSTSTLSTSTSCSESSTNSNTFFSYTQRKIREETIKFQGAHMAVPLPASTRESLYTVIGVLLTLLIIGGANQQVTRTYGGDWSIVMGPFGALLCLQFALTPAPAAQPRNAMVGQIIALTVALSVSYIPTAVFIREALATAITIGLMARLAVVHPPGGASALLFASGKYTWSNMFTMLVANMVAIGMFVLINNFNMQRQYPTYWGFGVTKNILCPKKAKPSEDESESEQ